jgi:predicted dehydrogenase
MRFALLGNHPDGLDMARALADSGRHQLAAYSGPAAGAERLRRWGLPFKTLNDLEEVLADPAVEAVIVAGRPAERPEQLRRALQSERPVLCVQPVDATPDTAYEAALIQGDTRQVLLPLLPEALHPGVKRLAELAWDPKSILGRFRLAILERWSPEPVLTQFGGKRPRAALPGWDVLRTVGGELAEVFAFASEEKLDAEAPLLVSGRFERGGLFQAAYLSGQQESRWRLSVIGSFAQADLLFTQGWPGPARLTWPGDAGELREETWEMWNPWPAMVEVFEQAREEQTRRQGDKETRRQGDKETRRQGDREAGAAVRLGWQDAVRCLELDDAARRSVEKRRASALEYQEVTEEAGFKGTMTLIGCGLIWGSLVLVLMSFWVPWAGWLVAPMLGVFLVLQLLRWSAVKPAD